MATLALVSGVCSLIVAYEALRYRESRVRVRHPDLANAILVALPGKAAADSVPSTCP